VIPDCISLKASFRIANNRGWPLSLIAGCRNCILREPRWFGGVNAEPVQYFFATCLQNGLNLLDAMVAADVRPIVFSCDCAFWSARSPANRETAQPRPISPTANPNSRLKKILRWYDRDSWGEICLPALLQCSGANREIW